MKEKILREREKRDWVGESGRVQWALDARTAGRPVAARAAAETTPVPAIVRAWQAFNALRIFKFAIKEKP
ncbi:hypothetical protein EVAR_36197_1 [Eumeta japonica]|uniref:Uncharacterized protein n=1 Tax=Eumeta variegata TaxID=151549 RepID=A0A4C1VRZ9_EUMVA|nr:hypothetical protein EVAR_36197_1 [Eumeta japonica]